MFGNIEFIWAMLFGALIKRHIEKLNSNRDESQVTMKHNKKQNTNE